MTSRLVLSAIALLSGCAPVYIPTPNNPPMFSKKGQGEILAGMAYSESAGYGQAAYSFSDHWAASAAGMFYIDKEEGSKVNYRFAEGALGYYTNLNNDFSIDLWGGVGWGNSSIQENCYNCFPGIFFGNDFSAKAKIRSVFIQPSFGKNRGKVQWNLSSKLNYLYFQKLNIYIDDILADRGPQAHCSLEPAFAFRMQVRKKLFWTFEAGYSIFLTDSKFSQIPVKASTGFGFWLGNWSRATSK